jgi:hypothetical protein
MEVQDLIGPQTKSVTKIEYLDIKPAQLDDRIFTPDGARALS